MHPSLRLLAVACIASSQWLLVACAHAPGASAASTGSPVATAPAQTAAPAATATSAAGVPALVQPRAGLWVSAQPAPEAWEGLAARGVRTVVNLRTDKEMAGRDEAAEVAAAGMAYLRLPVDGEAGINAANADALWAMLARVEGPVLVHCSSGNRAGGLLALGAARQGGMSPEAALAFGQGAGLTRSQAQVRSLLGLPAETGR